MPCRCGGTDYRRITSAWCPLNPRNTITGQFIQEAQVQQFSCLFTIPYQTLPMWTYGSSKNDEFTVSFIQVTQQGRPSHNTARISFEDFQGGASIRSPNVNVDGVMDNGSMTLGCVSCGAKGWEAEKVAGTCQEPRFAICCNQGKVQLPVLEPPPEELRQLPY
ncbi:uncharacterized protein BYT42DRAFT_576707 [Radiomyces spectabilis]|uniref:uncharacterized protein n=1 Tax=Radiomyces spectabilis TaxID=64574 RepID=UPI00221EF3D7|nr:uncharacterized protein BYT42DRAFT_576707 [Radiomyces spectabilis]KAI8374540.1 hypothetical protein BYT42DRAFT_576707 [Radiomyces spectabilis]